MHCLYFEQARLGIFAFFYSKTHPTLRVFFAGDFWYIVQTCHGDLIMHYETQLRNFERVDFWIQNRRNKKIADCGTQDMLWHVVIDMVDQAETTKFFSKFHCR